MDHHIRIRRIPSGWLATISFVIVAGGIALCLGAFNQSFTPVVPVTLTSDRSGLVMEPYAKVKMRGLQVGRVSTVASSDDQVRLQLDIDPDQIRYIPANVQARINASTLFGPKYVELTEPAHPVAERLAAGAVLKSTNVAVEVNTVFENLVELIKQVDPAKLNAVLSALAEGFRGQGPKMGESITDANQVLTALNARTDAMAGDWRAAGRAADAYSAAAQDILTTMSAVTTISHTVTDRAEQLDALLLGVAGLSRSGVQLLGEANGNIVDSINKLEPTSQLLLKYNPELTCLLVGAQTAMDKGLTGQTGGADGKSLIMDAAILLGDDPYRYPDNLPINGAKGGPAGKPGCGALPDVAQNWPVRYLVTNTGFGTGMDIRPNPGIGFPGWANYFPITRAMPEPPSIRYPDGPAPGPVPYLGSPPYGAPQYAPDGTPLYPGVPPIGAPPPDVQTAPAPQSEPGSSPGIQPPP